LLICKKKKIKKIGVSIYNQSELIKILKKGYPNIIQLPLNLINQKPISMNLIKKLKRNKVEIFARSIFLQGLFFLSLKDMVIQNKNIMNEIFRINMILKKNKLKFADASLTWVFNQKYIDKIIIGITKKKELEQNINYLKFGDKKFLNKKKVIDSLKLNDKRIIDPRYWILKKKNKKIVLNFKKNI
jgi:aryl-alcohol dehydrogenase-like predicted oxidoreductase